MFELANGFLTVLGATFGAQDIENIGE